LTIRFLPQRSQVIRRNQLGNVANGSSSASAGWATGRCRSCASAAAEVWSRLGPPHDLTEQCIGSIPSPPVLLRRHVGHVTEPARPLHGDDRRLPVIVGWRLGLSSG
jgi:hypothetical protein